MRECGHDGYDEDFGGWRCRRRGHQCGQQAAQYYPSNPGYQNPGYGYQNPGYGYQAPGYGYQNPGYGSGGTSQVAVNQCVAAVQQRLSGGYGNYPGSGSYGGYSYYPQANSYPGGQVLGISRVEPRSGGGLTVRGVASSGRYGAYGQAPADLTFRCVDYRGLSRTSTLIAPDVPWL